MAGRVPTYDDYKDAIEGINGIMEKLDLNNPSENIINPEITANELLILQYETQAQTVNQLLEFMSNMMPLTPDQPDVLQLMSANAGETVSVIQQQNYLLNLAKKNFLLTRMIQQRLAQKDAKATGSYADKTRDPICNIPQAISTGVTSIIGDSALKLITTFEGDGINEAQNLKEFLRSLFDIAVTNTLNEKCVKAALKRKLGGTARRLIDSYEQEFKDEDRPSLREMILKLEDRYQAEWQPEIANAKLSMCQKTTNQTIQKLEGEIAELAILAARAEKPENRTAWIKHRQIEVFKQAIGDDYRQIIYRENQSRKLTGLTEMTMSQMCDYLIKNDSESNAFAMANNLKKSTNNDTPSEGDSLNFAQDMMQDEKRKNAEEAEQQKLKDQVFSLYQAGINPFNDNSQRVGEFGNEDYPGDWENEDEDEQDENKLKPRKFVTSEMVGVLPNSCLKCGSSTHKFQEVEKCVYGEGNLMTKACTNCNEGGHHFTICIKDRKPTIGTQESQPQEPFEPEVSKWPEEANKSMPMPQANNGNWLPSLFPY